MSLSCRPRERRPRHVICTAASLALIARDADGESTAAGTGGRAGGSPAPPEGRQPGRGARQMRSWPSTAPGSPLMELILIRCTAACPRAARAVFSFSSDLQTCDRLSLNLTCVSARAPHQRVYQKIIPDCTHCTQLALLGLL